MRAFIWRSIVALATLWAFAPATATAQGSTWTGHELALSGPRAVRSGRTARYRGVAYRVRGLAELVPFEGRVRARLGWNTRRESQPWVDVASDAEGRFVVEVPVPTGAAVGGPRLEVWVGPDDGGKELRFPLRVEAGLELMLRTDRRLYEAGEPVHVWGLLRDVASRRPVANQVVELVVDGEALPSTRRTVRTNDAGVLHVELEVPDDAPEAAQQVEARIHGQLRERADFRVGTRTWERLFAEVEVEPDQVPPHGMATVSVRVTTPSGAPVADATVSAQVDGDERYRGTTDADGRLALEVRAPAYLEHETGRVPVRLEIAHPAHGSIRAFDSIRLAVPLALRVEVVPPHGGLVPEVDDVLYVRLRDGANEPPPAGTEVTVEGPAVRGGRATATTDEHGLAEVPARLPLGAASSRSGEPRTTVLVHVAGPLERTSRIGVRVLREAEVAPTLDSVVLEPGATLEVRLARRSAVEGLPAVVELLDARGEPVVVRWVSARARTARIDLPPDRLGLMTVNVRIVHEAESLEGAGASAPLLVRPPRPDFARLDAERERYTVGETARVRLHTGSGGPARYAAILVRDLAAHGGEVAFRRAFLQGAFDRAVLDPSGPAAERLVRAALAAHASADPAPPVSPPLVDALGLVTEGTAPTQPGARGTLRDPWPLAHDLSRRGVAAAMRAAEQRLEAALSSGALDDVTTTSGSRRRFTDDLLADADLPPTLGGAPVTPAILEAADPSFTYEHVARRVARARLVRLTMALALYLDPGDDAPPAARMAAREPSARWLPRMVERGLLDAHDLDDPWGGRFTLQRSRSPAIVVSAHATDLELVSPGPDGRPGTRDDVRDPFERAVPAGTPYAVASGEDRLMRRLAVLSPLARTLEAIRESYRRVNVEMTEEEIGDAVSANVSEGTIGLGNIGTIGHGGGSGSGSGYGRGAGGLGLRGTGRGGGGRSSGTTMRGLAAVVRERFPPTLLFRPSVVVDASGTTEIEVPLADAVTTYLVEAIVWREDGWISSGSTRIEVDRDVVVDAPVPGVAHRGDGLRLPVRVQNRGEEERTLVVRLLGDDALGVPDSAPRTVTVGPGGAAVVPVEVELSRVGRGSLSAVVTTPDGAAIDAVRRSMRVLAPARRVEVERHALADGEASVSLEVPAAADPREGVLRLSVGTAMFAATGEPTSPWALWAPTPGHEARVRLPSRHRDIWHLAFGLGAAWRDERTPDRYLVREVPRLARLIDRGAETPEDPGQPVRTRAWALLGLSPAAREPDRRGGASQVIELVARLREEVASGAVELSEDPEAWVVAAAALGWSGSGASGRERVAELTRRLSRHAVRIGDDRWLATETRALRSTLLWAMVELSLGRRESAFELVATVGRWVARGHTLAPDERAMARTIIARLLDGREPETAEVWIDGARTEVALEHGAAEVDASALAGPGAHRVRVRVADGAPVWVHVLARYGVPWSQPPPERGPFELSIEGEVHGLDEVAELELVVRNRMPRTLAAPVVEVELPTGAELTARDEATMREAVRGVERGGGVLTLTLAPMRPGNERRIPLPLRWSVAGRLEGLGVAARASDRPEAVSVLRPRGIEIVEVER